MICELVNDKFIDVVTGKVYRKKGYDDKEDNYVGPDILLNIGKKISSDEVVKFLKTLDKQDLFRYQDAVEEFEKAMKIGYSKYISKQNAEMKQNESNDNYIKNFRLTHK